MGDVWALGVLLYVMLSGKFPFKAQSQRELYRRIVRSSLVIPTDFSPQAKAVIEGCLCKDDSPRPTVAQLLRDPYFAGCTLESQNQVSTSTSSMSSLGYAGFSDATTATTITDVGTKFR